MIKTYEILNKMFLAIDKKPSNDAFRYILVEDSRKFTATNGHIMLQWEEKEDVTFKFPEPRVYVKMTHKLDDDREIIYETDVNYPDYKRILDNIPETDAEQYTMFDPKYIDILNKFMDDKWAYLQKPKMRDSQSAAKWEIGNKICVIMPVRVK